MKITHYLGDQCSSGHFDQASIRECAAWLENRLQSAPDRSRMKMGLKDVLRFMHQAGWEYGCCEYFDPGCRAWVSRWAFTGPAGSESGESVQDGAADLELAAYRAACMTLRAHPAETEAVAQSRLRR